MYYHYSPSERLLTRLDNEVDINLKLSVNFNLCFLIGTEKVIYFSVLFPKHSNCSSNSLANSLIIK